MIENNSNNVFEVKNAELGEKMNSLTDKLDLFSKMFENKFEEINKKIDTQMDYLNNFIKRDEFKDKFESLNKEIDSIQPAIKWANDRQAIEKFLVFVLSVMGISNILVIIKVLFYAN